MKSWSHEFQILEEEEFLECSQYIFKYVLPLDGIFVKTRTIEKTNHPLRFIATYTF
jgi:hypothetical protein